VDEARRGDLIAAESMADAGTAWPAAALSVHSRNVFRQAGHRAL